MKKGSKCAVVGRLQTSSYDAQDGSKRYTTDVVADEVEFISSARGGSDGSGDFMPSEPKMNLNKQQNLKKLMMTVFHSNYS